MYVQHVESRGGWATTNEFNVLQWFFQLPDRNQIEYLLDVVEREIFSMNVHLTNMQIFRDAIMSTWTRILKEYF